MAKLTSLSDLGSLLPDNQRDSSTGQNDPQQQTGYDGRPQKLDVALDKKRRRGKTVTLITGFQSKPEQLEAIGRTLRRECGTGGTVDDNAIELQGDHRTKVAERLKGMGYQVRLR